MVALAQSNHLRVSEHTGRTQYTLGQMAQRQQRVYRVVRSRSGVQCSRLGSGERVMFIVLFNAVFNMNDAVTIHHNWDIG